MNVRQAFFWPSVICAAAGSFAFAPQVHAEGGVPLWTNRYNGPGNSADFATAMALDGSGNVYVTGQSDGSGFDTNYDYATLAYSSAGVPLWTNRYNGPGNGDDVPAAIAVDSSGNVFVTGYSIGADTVYDYATIKYSSTGVLLWTNRYNGSGNGDAVAAAIAVDDSGNVFVTGESRYGTNSDYATIKYSSAGVPLWTNWYGGLTNGNYSARAVAVDGSGNVIVTGTSWNGTNSDYATVKYSSVGLPLWTNCYDGPGYASPFNGNDYTTAMAMDSSGNVFVTGYSEGSHGNSDYATVAYSGAGVPLWTNRYNGPGNDEDQPYAIAVDRGGNVLVTGYSHSSSSSYDYATVKYSNAGEALWTNLYNGPINYVDYAFAIAADPIGNVFVTGGSAGSGGNDAYATLAYSDAGVPLWTNRYNGPVYGGVNGASARAMVVDRNGNVYVTGNSIGSGGQSDFVTIKYSSSIPPIHLAIERDGSGGYYIRFNGVPGTAYRLQRSTNVASPWTTSAPQTAPASGFLEFHDLFPPPGQAFYRTVRP
jgi:uncharacterized delta-60 repeat protein